ncbi:MAG: HEPN domain-containing protein, partial [Nitrosotalea sp.]
VFKYWSTAMYVGMHFENRNEINFVSMSIQYSNLHKWMADLPFHTDSSRLENEHVLDVEYRIPDSARAEINDGFTLEIGYGFTYDMFTIEEEFKIEQTTSVIIRNETARGINNFMDVHRCFRYFLMLAMLHTVHPLSVKATINEDPNNSVIVFPSIQLYENIPKISTHDMLFLFPQISGNFQVFIRAWFELWGGFRNTLTVYFATLLDKGNTTIEIQFQRIAQVLEYYHRGRFPDTRLMPENDYETMINDMRTKLAGDRREIQYVNRFVNQGNGPNLEQRIRQLVDMCPLSFNDANEERGQFAIDVMNTRNLHAHEIDERRERAVTDPLRLIFLTHQMMALMEAYLITELPFPEPQRNNLIIRNRDKRNFARDHHEEPEDND